MKKACRICGDVKSLDEFHRAPAMRDGHRNECRTCVNERQRQRYAADRAGAIERVQAWQRANRDRVRRSQAAYRSSPEVKRRERDGYYRRTYGLSVDDLRELIVAQSDRCAICRQVLAGAVEFHVDHDHDTGDVRGVLCASCNLGIGLFKDDPDLVASAIGYLVGHRHAAREVRG